MKILFAIQGTGNGHLSRARDVYPELTKYAEVDVLVSGIQADVSLAFPVKYMFYGMCFIFGRKGGVDLWQTAKKLKPLQLIKDIRSFPLENYDLVVNDFEPVTAWACKLKRKPCIGLSHQSAVLHPYAPKPPKGDIRGELVLKHYAPVTSFYGFHFRSYDKNIFTPIIRREIREMISTDLGHFTVYLPAYDDKTLVTALSKHKDVQWQVFSKHNKRPFIQGNVKVQPIENTAFIRSMASSSGVLCGAGFEGPAEAMYLGKKLMVVPMSDQYEQQCNAAAAETLGVPVIKSLDNKYYERIRWWIEQGTPVSVNYPDQTADIVHRLIVENTPAYENSKKTIPAIG